MKVFRARTEGKPSELRSETFSGTVWTDPLMPATRSPRSGFRLR
jgi:hypothetical protein